MSEIDLTEQLIRVIIEEGTIHKVLNETLDEILLPELAKHSYDNFICSSPLDFLISKQIKK